MAESIKIKLSRIIWSRRTSLDSKWHPVNRWIMVELVSQGPWTFRVTMADRIRTCSISSWIWWTAHRILGLPHKLNNISSWISSLKLVNNQLLVSNSTCTISSSLSLGCRLIEAEESNSDLFLRFIYYFILNRFSKIIFWI